MTKIKQRIIYLSVILSVVFSIFSFAGCYKYIPQDSVDGLSDEKVQEIREAYFEIKKEEKPDYYTNSSIEYMVIRRCLGTYGDFIVIEFENGAVDGDTVIDNIIIDDVYIGDLVCGNMKYLVYTADADYDGDTFIYLQYAYDEGLVTKDDLIAMSELTYKSPEYEY